MIETHWSGIGALQQKIRVAARQAYKSEAVKALRAELEIEKKEVIKRTPLDTGALRKSIRLEGPIMAGRTIGFNMIAGGPHVTYAWHVHEDLETPRRVGGPKFIESVLHESAPYLARRVARRMGVKKLFG